VNGFWILLVGSLLGCGPEATDPDLGADEEDSGGLADTTVVTENPYSPYSGTCPTFTEGENSNFVSADLERTFELRLPENLDDAPLVFGWHWLGGNANQVLAWLELEDMVDSGAIVVAPESTGLSSEWDIMSGQSSIDATLMDDVLFCLWEQYQFDTRRVYTTGMSAGGLMSTYLIAYRSEVLAAAAPFSGGVYANYYVTPDVPIPVMLIWGGPSDTYGSFSFDVANQDLSAGLQQDGHFVVECDHDGGHTLPWGAGDMAWQFFQAHSQGQDEAPWADGLPADLPTYCKIP